MVKKRILKAFTNRWGGERAGKKERKKEERKKRGRKE
jgi:hypothetical protein